MRSRRSSCPTMTFLISNSRRSICPPDLLAAAICVTPCATSLIGRDAECRGRLVDGDGEAHAAEQLLAGCADQSGDDTDDLAAVVHERTAGASRVHRRVELDEAGERFRAARCR